MAQLLQGIEGVGCIRVEKFPSLRLGEKLSGDVEYAFVDQVIETGPRISATDGFPLHQIPSLKQRLVRCQRRPSARLTVSESSYGYRNNGDGRR
jgi:hypothetical protein